MIQKDKAFTLSVLALAALLLVPQFAQAKAKTIRAEDLRPQNPLVANYQVLGQFIFAMSPGINLWDTVKLPKGATITGLQVWALDHGGASGIVLMERSHDGVKCVDGSCIVAQVDLSAAAGQSEWVKLEDTTPNPALARVKKGDRYYVLVNPNTGVFVGTIKVFYTTP